MAVAVVVIFIMQSDLKLDSSQNITRPLDLLPNPYVVRGPLARDRMLPSRCITRLRK